MVPLVRISLPDAGAPRALDSSICIVNPILKNNIMHFVFGRSYARLMVPLSEFFFRILDLPGLWILQFLYKSDITGVDVCKFFQFVSILVLEVSVSQGATPLVANIRH